VAANSGAPPDPLLELSHSSDKAVRKACTSNANTPVEALLKLGTQFPEQLLENAVFDLLLLAQPGPFEELPTSTLNSLLKRDQVPVELIRWAWKHHGESTLHSLLMNPNTPADVVEELCKSKDPEVRMAAELHCSQILPEWAEEIHSELGLHSAKHVAPLMRMHSAEWWDSLLDILPSTLPDWQERGFVNNLPRSHCLTKAGKSSSQELLILLSYSNDWQILHELSINRCCPAEALARLARANKHIKMNVALHCNTDPCILAELSLDADWEVRMASASSTLINQGYLARLAQDVVDEVRAAAGGNRCAPNALIEALASDQSLLVRESVAGNESTPSEVLCNLSKDNDRRVRCRVALNTSTRPLDLLSLKRNDDDPGVREYAAKTICLTDRKRSETYERIRNTPPHTIQMPGTNVSAVNQGIECELRRILAIGTRGSSPSPNRRFLFTLPQCPPSILAKHFRSRSWLERFAIAGNPSTPEVVLERMVREGNQLVRRAAADNLASRGPATN
jgi:hypothetical protein